MTLTEIAQLLGVSPNQVFMWHKRRHTNGFPEPFGSTIYNPRGGRRRAPIFDREAVAAWHADYDPNRGRGAHWAQKRRQAA